MKRQFHRITNYTSKANAGEVAKFKFWFGITACFYLFINYFFSDFVFIFQTKPIESSFVILSAVRLGCLVL